MKTYLTLAAATLALAACGNKTDADADTTPMATDTAMATPMATTAAATGNMAGTYEVTMADGSKMTETINADGTYTDVMDGKETRGTWRMDGEKACFDPEGDKPEVCHTTTAPGADGSFTATTPDGTTMTVRKVGAAPAM